MTMDKVLEATWSEFATLLGYPPSDEIEDDGWRVHDSGTSMDKIVLAPLYDQAQNFVVGKTAHLQKDYDIMHRVYRETLAAKTGNFDEMHGFVVDLMFRSHANRGLGRKLNVMDYIFHEMKTSMVERKVPPYGPYIQALINKKWSETIATRLEEQMTATYHLGKELCMKKLHLEAPQREQAAPETGGGEEEVYDHYAQYRKPDEPTWMGRLMRKIKKSFCLKMEMQDCAYEAYVESRKACQRQKAIMRKLDIPVSPETSKSITPRDKWCSEYVWMSSNEEYAHVEVNRTADPTAPSSSRWHG
jgi:hypothetical protein